MRVFFQCVAEAVAEKGLRVLADMVPFGGAVFDIAKATWDKYQLRRQVDQMRQDVERIANAGVEEVKQIASDIARLTTNDQLRPAVEVFLEQIPAAVRQSLKRAEDATGKSVPAGFRLRGPEDVAKLLPRTLPRFKPGDPLPGRPGWVLDRFLSGGGFGEVWIAEQKLFGFARAIKFCKSLQKPDRDLRHEGGLISRLIHEGKHPNVVPLLDAYLDGESPWLMYEYVEGGDLGDRIRFWATLAPIERQKRAVTALQLLAKATGRFHQLTPPIVHRDLKPANILYDKNSRQLRITDFGIGGIAARDMLDGEKSGALTNTGRLQSYLYGSYTPLYASPQQKAGEPPDPRDDVHALGVIAYQMLTCQMNQGVGSDYVHDLRELEVGDPLIELVGRCTSQKAERRPRDGGEIADSLPRLILTLKPEDGSKVRLADSARPPTQTRVVPDEYPGIQLALDASKPGDTVLLRPGDYRETVRLVQGVTLRGDNRQHCRILPVEGAEYALKAENITGGAVVDLTFDSEDKSALAGRDGFPDGILIENSIIVVESCHVLGWAGAGVSIKGAKSAPTLRGNTCRQNKYSGIYVCGQAQPTLEANTCRENKCGIAYFGSAEGTALNNTCAGNQTYGICVAEQAHPTLEANTCRENKWSGIAYFGSAAGTARNNTCAGNETNGIYVGQQAHPTLEGNTCRDNKKDGMSYFGEASGVARNNVCVANGNDGVHMAPSTKPQWERNNRCSGNNRKDVNDKRTTA